MVLLASSYDVSRFFKAEDLQAEKKLRVKTVTEESVGVGAEQQKKLVVWFTSDERGLVLNKTNNRTMRGAFGDDCAGWTGKVVVLFPSTVDLRGKMVPSLRVRIPPPKQTAAGNGAAKPVEPEPPKQAAAGNGAPGNLDIPDFMLRTKPEPEQPAAKPAAKPSIADELNDEIPW